MQINWARTLRIILTLQIGLHLWIGLTLRISIAMKIVRIKTLRIVGIRCCAHDKNLNNRVWDLITDIIIEPRLVPCMLWSNLGYLRD